jgi:hypothetical protein
MLVIIISGIYWTDAFKNTAKLDHIKEKKIVSNTTDIYAGVYHITNILDSTLQESVIINTLSPHPHNETLEYESKLVFITKHSFKATSP